jgi:tetratricopeptide (TPR) repeat protein
VQTEPEVLVALARQDLSTGQLAAAQEKCLQALDLQRSNASALSLLAQILSTQGQHDEAVRVFESLTRLHPTVAGYWVNLGTALRLLQRQEEALTAFERALQLGAPSAGLLYNLGWLQMDRCDYQAAYIALRDAAALAPQSATIRWSYAQCCYELALTEEALGALQDWQKLDGLSIEITVRIILLLVSMGAGARAADVLARMRQVPPADGRAAVIFASILERLNHLDEARTVLARALANEPALGNDAEQLLMSAVLADRFDEHEIAYQKSTLALQHNRDVARQHTLLFVLARACDALGRYEEAFSTAERAHVAQQTFVRAATGMSSMEQSQTWTLSSKLPDVADIGSWTRAGPARARSPVFIVGFPRSGTTLIEQVLDAHPLLQSLDEQPLMMRSLEHVLQQGIRYPDELGKLSEPQVAALRAAYWDRARRQGLLAGRRLVDKNPLNMVLLPLIKRMFPEASIVLAVRHPCDTLLSCFMQNFSAPGVAMLCTDLETLARVYDRVFSHWYRSQELLSPSIHELRYERLATSLREEVERLQAFLGLPQDEAALDPAKVARTKGFISTPSYTQVVRPVTGRSVGRWKHYAAHFTDALPLLQPWIERWGYTES